MFRFPRTHRDQTVLKAIRGQFSAPLHVRPGSFRALGRAALPDTAPVPAPRFRKPGSRTRRVLLDAVPKRPAGELDRRQRSAHPSGARMGRARRTFLAMLSPSGRGRIFSDLVRRSRSRRFDGIDLVSPRLRRLDRGVREGPRAACGHPRPFDGSARRDPRPPARHVRRANRSPGASDRPGDVRREIRSLHEDPACGARRDEEASHFAIRRDVGRPASDRSRHADRRDADRARPERLPRSLEGRRDTRRLVAGSAALDDVRPRPPQDPPRPGRRRRGRPISGPPAGSHPQETRARKGEKALQPRAIAWYGCCCSRRESRTPRRSRCLSTSVRSISPSSMPSRRDVLFPAPRYLRRRAPSSTARSNGASSRGLRAGPSRPFPPRIGRRPLWPGSSRGKRDGPAR